MKQEHLDYLESHIVNYHMVRNDMVRNLDLDMLLMYENIYKLYLDERFVLTKWCSNCVMDMLKRVYEYYLALPQEEVQQLTQAVEIVIKKRGRPKK